MVNKKSTTKQEVTVIGHKVRMGIIVKILPILPDFREKLKI